MATDASVLTYPTHEAREYITEWRKLADAINHAARDQATQLIREGNDQAAAATLEAAHIAAAALRGLTMSARQIGHRP